MNLVYSTVVSGRSGFRLFFRLGGGPGGPGDDGGGPDVDLMTPSEASKRYPGIAPDFRRASHSLNASGLAMPFFATFFSSFFGLWFFCSFAIHLTRYAVMASIAPSCTMPCRHAVRTFEHECSRVGFQKKRNCAFSSIPDVRNFFWHV